jgi:hypothetical protein
MSEDSQLSDGSECEKCGWEENEIESLIQVEVPLTGEYWMLCDGCIDKLNGWVNSGNEHSKEGSQDV